MQAQDSERTINLLGSVQAWFNQSYEAELRVQEAENGLTKSEHKLLRPLPIDKTKILDIGCAAGRTSIALAQAGQAVTGIDVAEKLIEKAKKEAEKQALDVTFQVCDPIHLPFSDGTFDAALLLKTYCYGSSRKNRIAWLNEIARVIKPEGWLFLSQYIIDDVLGSYAPIKEENRSRFPDLLETLEEGDGFTLPAEGSETVGFVHYFMEADLLNELETSRFKIIGSFREGTIFYCSLKR